jgi:hypothetical protein
MVEVHTDEGIAGLAKIRTVELLSLAEGPTPRVECNG